MGFRIEFEDNVSEKKILEANRRTLESIAGDASWFGSTNWILDKKYSDNEPDKPMDYHGLRYYLQRVENSFCSITKIKGIDEAFDWYLANMLQRPIQQIKGESGYCGGYTVGKFRKLVKDLYFNYILAYINDENSPVHTTPMRKIYSFYLHTMYAQRTLLEKEHETPSKIHLNYNSLYAFTVASFAGMLKANPDPTQSKYLYTELKRYLHGFLATLDSSFPQDMSLAPKTVSEHAPEFMKEKWYSEKGIPYTRKTNVASLASKRISTKKENPKKATAGSNNDLLAILAAKSQASVAVGFEQKQVNERSRQISANSGYCTQQTNAAYTFPRNMLCIEYVRAQERVHNAQERVNPNMVKAVYVHQMRRNVVRSRIMGTQPIGTMRGI